MRLFLVTLTEFGITCKRHIDQILKYSGSHSTVLDFDEYEFSSVVNELPAQTSQNSIDNNVAAVSERDGESRSSRDGEEPRSVEMPVEIPVESASSVLTDNSAKPSTSTGTDSAQQPSHDYSLRPRTKHINYKV